MKFTKLAGNFLFIVFLSGSFVVNLFAQCDGVYFKTVNRKIFTAFIAFNPDITPTPSLQKDVTGDGLIDLFGIYGIGNGMIVVPGEGNGNFGSFIAITLPPPSNFAIQPSAYFVEDFNNDGLNDLFAQLNTSPPTFVIHRSNGGGSFTQLATTVLPTFHPVHNIFDINNDNRADLFFSGFYRLGNADGSFGEPIIVSHLTDNRFKADFNADGKIDLANIGSQDGTPVFRTYFNLGSGFIGLATITTVGNPGDVVSILGIADFNNDGKPDAIVRNGSQFILLTGTGNGNFSKTNFPLNLPNAENFHVGDFNGDGFKDVLAKPSSVPFGNKNPLQPTLLFINTGSGSFTSVFYDAPVRSFPIGDLDGDNKTDFMLFVNYGRNRTDDLPMLFGETQVHFQKNVCKKPGRTKIVDFDGDNIADKAFFRPTDGRWRFKKSSDNSIVSVNWGLSGDITQPGDYDGDGKSDVAVFRPSNGTWYIVNSSDGSYTIIQFGIGEDKPVSSDFDGDGTTDIAVFRPSDGNWYIYHTGTGQVSVTHFGISGDKPVQEDYDGDGRTDLAVFRPSTGIWYYLKSSDGNFAAINWGISTDILVPADYDGDGKADFGVYRASDRKWYILRSSNFQFTAYGFGITGDIPQPSDWDGSETFDPGIYRPDTKLWYSTNTIHSETFGETGEIPTSSILKVQ